MQSQIHELSYELGLRACEHSIKLHYYKQKIQQINTDYNEELERINDQYNDSLSESYYSYVASLAANKALSRQFSKLEIAYNQQIQESQVQTTILNEKEEIISKQQYQLTEFDIRNKTLLNQLSTLSIKYEQLLQEVDVAKFMNHEMINKLHTDIALFKEQYDHVNNELNTLQQLYAVEKDTWNSCLTIEQEKSQGLENQLHVLRTQSTQLQETYTILYRKYIQQCMVFNAKQVCTIIHYRQKYQSIYKQCIQELVSFIQRKGESIKHDNDIVPIHTNDSIVPSTPRVSETPIVKYKGEDVEAYRIACASLSSQLYLAHQEIATLQQQLTRDNNVGTLTNSPVSASSTSVVLSRKIYEHDINQLNQQYINAISNLYDERIRNQMNNIHLERIHNNTNNPKQIAHQLTEAQRINYELIQEITRQNTEIKTLHEQLFILQQSQEEQQVISKNDNAQASIVVAENNNSHSPDNTLRTVSKPKELLRRLDLISTPSIVSPTMITTMKHSSPILQRLSPALGISPSSRNVSLFAVATGLAVPSITTINNVPTSPNVQLSTLPNHTPSSFRVQNNNTPISMNVPYHGIDKENIPTNMNEPLLLSTEKKSNHTKSLRKDKAEPKILTVRSNMESNVLSPSSISNNTTRKGFITKETISKPYISASIENIPENTRLLMKQSLGSNTNGSNFFTNKLTGIFSKPSSQQPLSSSIGYVPPYGTVSTTATGGVSYSLLPPPPSFTSNSVHNNKPYSKVFGTNEKFPHTIR